MDKVKFKQVMSWVERELRLNPETNDSDSLLCAIIWYKQYEAIKHAFVDPDDYITFLRRLINKELFTPESITRARRKLQELYPELRGKTYFKRKRKQTEVKNYINKLKNNYYND